MSTLRAVIFDLDGTLVDTAPDLHAALNVAFRAEKLPTATIESVRDSVGFGALAMIRKALAINSVSIESSRETALHQTFLNHYRDHIADLSKPYNHCRETLEYLSNQNILMAICTNKPRDLALPLINALAIDSFFAFVSGGLCPSNKKPHQDHINSVLSAINVLPENAIMVGDTHVDIEAAKNSSVRSVALKHGYSDRPCEQLGATWLFNDFEELKNHLHTLITVNN